MQLKSLNWKSGAALFILLVIAFYLRVTGYDWGISDFHPDERFIMSKTNDLRVETVPYTAGEGWWSHLLRTTQLNLEPESGLDPKRFAYGTFPHYLLMLVNWTQYKVHSWFSSKAQYASYDDLKDVGRPLSAVAGTLSIWLLYLIAARYWKRGVAFLAAVFLSFAVLHIQLCHYYSFDAVLGFFVTLAIYFYVRIIEKGSLGNYVGAAVATALSLACKVSAAPLLLPFAMAFVLGRKDEVEEPAAEAPSPTPPAEGGVSEASLSVEEGVPELSTSVEGGAAEESLSASDEAPQSSPDEGHEGTEGSGGESPAPPAQGGFVAVPSGSKLGRGWIGWAGLVVFLLLADRIFWINNLVQGTAPALRGLRYLFLVFPFNATATNPSYVLHSLMLIAVMGLLYAFSQTSLGAWMRRWHVLHAYGAALLLLRVLYVAEPFAFIDHFTFWRDVAEQSAMVSGDAALPYTIQYQGTIPYFYYFANLTRWLLGWPLGLAVCFGLFYAIGKFLYRYSPAGWIILAWVVPSFVVLGRFQVKFPRYLVPLLPFFCLFGAMLLWDLCSLIKGISPFEAPSALRDFFNIRTIPSRLKRRIGALAIVFTAITILFSAYYSFQFVKIYHQVHPWVSASVWMYENVPAGSKVLVEHWDDTLPVGLDKNRLAFGSPELPAMTQDEYDKLWKKNGGSYRQITMGNYEADTPQKIDMMVQQLTQGDFLALSTKRLYGSILRVPERFPLTSRYYRALFAGKLGYELVATFSNPPKLFGYPINDELADESFSVYDHPKACIFKKIQTLPPEVLKATILDPPAEAKVLTMKDILQAQPGAPTFAPKVSFPVLKWLILLELLGLAALPIVFWLCPGLPDRGISISKTMGILLFTFVTWFLVSIRWFTFSRPLAVVLYLLFLVVGYLCYRRQKVALCAYLREHWKTFFMTELVYLVGFTIFLGIRMHNPDVYWGEKPMNMSFLASVDRSLTFPPADPWYSGVAINYYYYGFLIIGILGKVLGLPPVFTFNLACGLMPALAMMVGFGILYNLTRRYLFGCIAAWFMALMGNFQSFLQICKNLVMEDKASSWLDGLWVAWGYALRLLFSSRADYDWNTVAGKVHIPLVGFNSYFWKSGHDIIPGTAANEFPMWAFTFADLHAHIIVMPFFLMFVSLCLNLLLSLGNVCRRTVGGWVHEVPDLEPNARALVAPSSGHYASAYSFLLHGRFVFYALAFGVIACINAWDLPSSLFLLLAVLLVLFWRYPACTSVSSLWCISHRLRTWGIAEAWRRRALIIGHQLLNKLIIPLVLIVASGFALFLPFQLNFHPKIKMGLESVHLMSSMEKTSEPTGFGKIFALFLFIVMSYLIVRTVQHLLRKKDLARTIIFTSIAVLVCVLTWVAYRQVLLRFGVNHQLAALLTPWLLLNLYLLLQKGNSRQATFGLMISLLGLGIAWGVEVWYIREFMGARFNTIFKLYLEIWNLWALASAYFIYRLFSPSRTWPTLFWRVARRTLLSVWAVALVGLVLCCALFAVFGPYSLIATDGHTNRSSVATVNGLKFKQEDDPYEYASILWMNRFIPDSPAFVEAEGPIYGEFSRISMYTGLPAVIGWDNHERERGQDDEQITKRKKDVSRLYSTPDATEFSNILNTYDVRYVYFGKLEKEKYGPNALQRMKEFGNRLTVEYENPGVTIFSVRPGWSEYLVHTEVVTATAAAAGGEKGTNMMDAVQGSENGNFDQPRGVAVGPKGDIYVADTFNHRVQVFSASGEYERKWGEEGSMDGQFKEPNDILVDSQGKVYMLDTWNGRVQVFDDKGKFLNSFGDGFFGPRALTIDKQGRIYIADTGNGVVKVYSNQGQSLGVLGKKALEGSTAPGEFYEPVGVAVAPDGNIYIVDTRNARVQIFSPAGNYLKEWPLKTAWNGQGGNECHMAISPEGRVFIADPAGNRVVEYDLEGNPKATTYQTSVRGQILQSPVGIALTKDGNLVVTELQAHRVSLVKVNK